MKLESRRCRSSAPGFVQTSSFPATIAASSATAARQPTSRISRIALHGRDAFEDPFFDKSCTARAPWRGPVACRWRPARDAKRRRVWREDLGCRLWPPALR